jgi:hypothetical protein
MIIFSFSFKFWGLLKLLFFLHFDFLAEPKSIKNLLKIPAKIYKKFYISNHDRKIFIQILKTINIIVRVSIQITVESKLLPGAVSKVKNFLTARCAKATQRAQYVDNQNYHFASPCDFFAISLRPLRLKILLRQPLRIVLYKWFVPIHMFW